jgi:hypothetical protein
MLLLMILLFYLLRTKVIILDNITMDTLYLFIYLFIYLLLLLLLPSKVCTFVRTFVLFAKLIDVATKPETVYSS